MEKAQKKEGEESGKSQGRNTYEKKNNDPQ